MRVGAIDMAPGHIVIIIVVVVCSASCRSILVASSDGRGCRWWHGHGGAIDVVLLSPSSRMVCGSVTVTLRLLTPWLLSLCASCHIE